MLAETQDDQEIIERVAALDIGKAELMCCVRVPDEDRPGRRLQEVQPYPTMTRSLLRLADRLRSLGVSRVVMEATSDYWKPVFYVLEAAGLETWLVNAEDVKHLPGRPKTDRLDAAGRAARAEVAAEKAAAAAAELGDPAAVAMAARQMRRCGSVSRAPITRSTWARRTPGPSARSSRRSSSTPARRAADRHAVRPGRAGRAASGDEDGRPVRADGHRAGGVSVAGGPAVAAGPPLRAGDGVVSGRGVVGRPDLPGHRRSRR
jgi:Transposase